MSFVAPSITIQLGVDARFLPHRDDGFTGFALVVVVIRRGDFVVNHLVVVVAHLEQALRLVEVEGRERARRVVQVFALELEAARVRGVAIPDRIHECFAVHRQVQCLPDKLVIQRLRLHVVLEDVHVRKLHDLHVQVALAP